MNFRDWFYFETSREDGNLIVSCGIGYAYVIGFIFLLAVIL